MDLPRKDGRRLAYAGELVAAALAYVALGKLGLAMSLVSGYATLVWPPTGFALAVILLGGYRFWPAIAGGTIVTNLLLGVPYGVAIGVAAGNTLTAVLAAGALRRIPGFRASLDRFADVAGLAVLGGLASPLVSATVGTMSLVAGGVVATPAFARTWLAWWAGDMMGILVVAPVLLTWARAPWVRPRRAAIVEGAAIAIVLIACSAIVFSQRLEAVVEVPILQPYVLFLPLIWAALRFGTRGASLGVLLVAFIAVLGTHLGRGAFARGREVRDLVALHVFLASASAASLALGAVVSERERSRSALREREGVLRAVMSGTIDAVFVKDRDGRYLMVNAACARLAGVTAESVLGWDDAALFSPEEFRRMRAIDEEVMATGEPRTLEEPVILGGTRRIFHTTKSPLRDDAGNIVGVIGIARDITERTRIAEELRASEERVRLAIQAADLGTWCWSPRAGELEWSALCKEMHGIGAGEPVTFARFLAALHPDDREATEREAERSIAERCDYRIEHRVVRPDGGERWLSVLGRPFYDAAGRFDRMLGVAIDVTALKQAEQRRAELLERERAAVAEAQAATRAKDEFLAVLSHELRTPLQAMLGWTQMLQAPGVDPHRLRKGLEAIERNVRTQGRIIEDLLDVSRIVAGKLRLAKQRFDLADAVVPAVESAKAEAEARSIRLDARIAPLGGVIYGDPDRLQQVVSNLLTNAVKFTPSGGRVSLRLERAGAAARVVVTDTGSGISPEFLPHVFDRFRQAECTISRSHGGLGLGLAIARHLIEQHGGTITADSAGKDQGATFTVTLPLVSEARDAAERRNRRRGDAGAPAALAGVRVLVVDDDGDACELLETALQESGADVHAVRSARAALGALESFRPDLLVSDIGMPGEDGYALLRHVRARESAEGGHLAAIALTAFASQADREQALAAGFEAHLAKPVSLGDLTRAAASLVCQRRAP